jgi:predicted transcriptional regulator
LSDELVAALDAHASSTGRSRSALIREAIEEWLAVRREHEAVEQWLAGYDRTPVAEPDEWGDLAAEADRHGHELAQRLDAEDAASGHRW